MKKGLLGLVVLGAIAGTVAYKLKKNQQEKELLDEELEILSGVETEENDEETQESSDEESEEPDEIVTEVFEETEEPSEKKPEALFEEPEESEEEVFEELEETTEEHTEVEELDEEICEYDFSDKLEEIVEEIENNSAEEIISEEIIENPFIEETEDDYKIEFESNDEVIEEFDENIDNFEEERPIQHTIDFKSVEDMETYKHVVVEKGYVVTRGENPYQLSVLHIAPSNKRELLVNVYYLANQAVKHNGSYQGWQSRKVL